MGIDTSIYQNIRPMEMPSPLDSASKAMALSSLARQNRQADIADQDQQAVRSAFAKNIGPDGQVNRAGVLSALAQTSPLQALDYQGKFAQMDAAQADQKQKVISDKINQLAFGSRMAMSAKDQPSYEAMLQKMQGMGMDMSHMPAQFDPGLMRQYAMATLDQKQALEAQIKTSEMDINQAKAPLERRKLAAETAKTESETYKRNPDTLGQTDDPAKLVPGYVPKEHQAKAFAEIDAAENTKRMSKAILDSFDQAAMDTTKGPGAALSVVRDPRSVLALHQSMQPTFKDLEGTVRQAAMDNTFKNVTPSWSDSDTEIATKRAALQDYLKSKLSAPTARGYGIDLSKFDSTSPYESTPRPGARVPIGLFHSAQAGEPTPQAPAAAGPGAAQGIRMQGPDGRVRIIPAAMVGEAIAAGGKKVQ